MIAVGHTSVGVVTALLINQAVPATTTFWLRLCLVALVAFVSHYVTDFIPHGHYSAKIDPRRWWTNWPLMIDLVSAAAIFVGIGFLRFGLDQQLILMIVGIAAAQLTDVWDWYIVSRGWVPLRGAVLKHRKFHELIHWHSTTDAHGKRHGLPLSPIDIWQVLAAATALYLVLTV